MCHLKNGMHLEVVLLTINFLYLYTRIVGFTLHLMQKNLFKQDFKSLAVYAWITLLIVSLYLQIL